MKIENLSDEVNQRLHNCVTNIAFELDYYFPEFRLYYKDSFDDKIFMSLYIELIHVGFFNE